MLRTSPRFHISEYRRPLLLILGNPASHSVKESMFFSFEGDKKEHRFWKDILAKSGVLEPSYDSNLPVTKLNKLRKNQLLDLDYKSPFRIGLCVFISMPSAPSGPCSGIAGVQKLIGAKAMKELEKEESQRVIECAKKFCSRMVLQFPSKKMHGMDCVRIKTRNINLL